MLLCVLVVVVVCLGEGVARRSWMIPRRLAGLGVGFGSVDALAYLGPRPRGLAAGDLMVDRSFRWSDCGRSAPEAEPRHAGKVGIHLVKAFVSGARSGRTSALAARESPATLVRVSRVHRARVQRPNGTLG